MVHNVESLLEETLPQLRKAQELKLLKQHEIRTIVKKRRDHEHLIRRRDATRQNFFRYAVFEKDVAKLIQQRSRKRNLPPSESRPLIGQFKLQRARVYNRAVYKFPGDEKLWIYMAKDAIDDGAFKRASRIFAQAVSRCGGCPQIWLAAIAFHFDACSDPRTARVLAQRALRTLSANVTLWMEYFRMELYYLSKLTARRFTIGFDVRKPSEDASAEKRGSLERNALDASQESSPVVGKAEFWEGGVPLAVIKGAVSKVSLNEIHRVELYKTASDCPLVPSTLLLKLVDAFQSSFPSCLIVKCMKVGVFWDVINADMNRDTARRNNDISGDAEKPKGSNTVRFPESLLNDEQVAVELETLIKQNIAELSNSCTRKALLLLLASFEHTVGKLEVAGIDEVIQALTRMSRFVEKTNSDMNVIRNTTSEVKYWTLPILKSYYQGGDDKLDVSYEDIYTAVKEQCLVPFRNTEQDDVLSMYFGRDIDLSRVVLMCEEMVPLPPVSMACLFAASKAILRLLADSEGIASEKRSNLVALVQKLFRKARLLPDANSNVPFWIAYVDFERRIVQDAAEASAINTRAMRTLDKLYHNSFLEELALQTLS